MKTNITLTRSVQIWRVAQVLVWLVGIGIVFALLFFPPIGIHLIWNILIPVAPALLVIATGVWRNVCPLAFTSLLPKRLGFSKNIKLSDKALASLNLIGLVALLLIVPLRHLALNTNALITAVILIVLGLTAFLFGLFFESKSGWCSGLCPVHPVEKLYGTKNILSAPNAHCIECKKCTTLCPDSTSNINPLSSEKSVSNSIAGYLIIGGFPGFIWGWFQVPDYYSKDGFSHLDIIYGYPLGAMLLSMVAFMIIKGVIPSVNKRIITNIFAASAVSLYYWFRLPNLFGFGQFPEDGMLVDLKGILPEAIILIAKAAFTVFFFWWMVIRKENKISWLIRPNYAKELTASAR